MGFSVTVAHVIFFVALLSAGSVAMGAHWSTTHDVEDARRLYSERADAAVHSAIYIATSNPTYQSGPQRFQFTVHNTGSEVLTISKMVYIVDGVYVNASTIEKIEVSSAGATPTDLLLPGDSMVVKLRPITTSPSGLKVVTEYGTSAYWRP